MKIAVILPWGARFSPSASPGAIELCVKDFIAHSRFRDTTVVITNPPEHDGQVHPPYDVCEFRPAALTRIRANRTAWHRALIDQLLDIRPDVIQVQQTPVTAHALKGAFPKTPVILHRHDAQFPGNPIKRWLIKRDIRAADFVICNSDFILRHHIKHCGTRPEATQRIYNGINFALNEAGQTKEQLIVCVAARMPRKGPELFAGAIKPILAANPTWHAAMVCVTTGTASSRFARNVEELIESARTATSHGRFRRFDTLPHATVMELYRRASIAVIPSQWDEPFGRTALEAVASKATIVSSGRGGLREITDANALYPEAQSAEAYRKAIQSLIDAPERSKSMADAALENAHRLFDAQTVAAQYDTVMSDLAGTRGRSDRQHHGGETTVTGRL
ncbi:MAG: glycosyltransferase family 4 protein [Pseudomonadota bacterium]